MTKKETQIEDTVQTEAIATPLTIADTVQAFLNNPNTPIGIETLSIENASVELAAFKSHLDYAMHVSNPHSKDGTKIHSLAVDRSAAYEKNGISNFRLATITYPNGLSFQRLAATWTYTRAIDGAKITEVVSPSLVELELANALSVKQFAKIATDKVSKADFSQVYRFKPAPPAPVTLERVLEAFPALVPFTALEGARVESTSFESAKVHLTTFEAYEAAMALLINPIETLGYTKSVTCRTSADEAFNTVPVDVFHKFITAQFGQEGFEAYILLSLTAPKA